MGAQDVEPVSVDSEGSLVLLVQVRRLVPALLIFVRGVQRDQVGAGAAVLRRRRGVASLRSWFLSASLPELGMATNPRDFAFASSGVNGSTVFGG
jgi:hypothetical protein